MGEDKTMTTLAMGVIAAGATLAQGYSQYKQGKYQANVYNAQADAYANAAYRKRLETSINADTQRRENRQSLARKIASTIELGGGDSQTSIGALGQFATNLEQNALNTEYMGLSQAESYQDQANSMYYMGKYTKQQGKNAWNASLIKAPLSFAGGYMMAGGTMPEGIIGNIGTGMAMANDIWDFVETGDMSKLGEFEKSGAITKFNNRWGKK